MKQTGTGPSRRHIQGSKIAKRLPSVKYSFTVLENRNFFEKKIFGKITYSKKMDRVARRGSLARAPGALKSHNAEKLKGGPFGTFQHPFCCKTSKKCRGDPLEKFFRKKSLAVPKKMKGGVFGLARYGMLRGKTGKTILVQFARPNSAF